MCSRHRPANGADSEPLTDSELLNVYVADSIVRGAGWKEWLRAKHDALTAERVAIVERLIEARIIPSAFTDNARRLAIDPRADLAEGLPPATGRMRTDPWPRPWTARRP